MAGLALGLIETVGLIAAIEAADAAVKSANVKLIGYENSKGGGLITIKLQGEVGAVKAAVQAGCAAASKVSAVKGSLVIPRPHDELTFIFTSKETVGFVENESCPKTEIEKEVSPEINEALKEDVKEEVSEEVKVEILHEVTEIQKVKDQKDIKVEVKVNENATCNLCNDINCKRKKGDPKSLCINYKDLKNLKEE
ncbi:MAG: BMC domain-containing protein [Clostridiaceae bacterium]